MKHITELSECPHCGHNEWYRKQRVKGEIIFRERFDGKETENFEMYDGISHRDTSKFAYCSKCHKKIGKLVKEGK